MKFKRTVSGLLALSILTLGTFSTVGSANAVEVETKDIPLTSAAVNVSELSADSTITKNYGLCDNIEDGVILHAWCWSFNTIKEHMEEIAAAGYTAVQTSPANLCAGASYGDKLMGNDIEGYDGKLGAWWWQYQPVDFTIGNYQLGTEDEYKEMCKVAHDYGVKVITDVVANHTVKDYTQVSDNLLKAVGISTNPRPAASSSDWLNLYHKGWNTYQEPDHSIRYQTTFYNLEGKSSDYGLRDLNTENKNYQAYLLDTYINQLLIDGCDGFRYDTAKHIAVYDNDNPSNTNGEPNSPNNFWKVVTGQETVTDIKGNTVRYNYKNDNGSLTKIKDTDPFVYGEALQGESNTPYSEYTKYMKVTASTYGIYLTRNLREGDFTKNKINSGWAFSGVDSSKLVTWVESHDTYCNKHTSADLDDDLIRKGWAIVAARSGGTPLFFSRPDGSTRDNYWGNNKIGEIGNSEFQNDEVKAVNHFHNAMANVGASSESLKYINGSKKMFQIDRYNSSNNVVGKCGTVIVNISDKAYDIDTVTEIAVGEYKDSVSNNLFTVYRNSNDGKNYIKGRINADSVAVIYLASDITLSVSEDSCDFTSDYLSVTLNTNGTNATYTLNDSAETSFTNGTVLNIGETDNVSDSSKVISLTVKAQDSSGNTFKRYYTYTKRSSKDLTYIYFDKSAYSSWSSVYVYIYNPDSNNYSYSNAAWPGIKMTDTESSTGYYKMLVPYALKNGQVVFSDNGSSSRRYPADQAGGKALNGKSMLFGASYSWTEYSGTDIPEIIDNENIPDEDIDLDTYRYVYFFNSLGWNNEDGINHITATLTNDSGTKRTGNMTWSEDLHCYYYKYGVNHNYNKITFGGKDNNDADVSASSLEIKPGQVFVPTSSSAGEWISLENISEHTIYFYHYTSKFLEFANVYLWRKLSNGTVIQNGSFPGEAMTKLTLGSITENGALKTYNYKYTYYYPKLSGDNAFTDYEYVIFQGTEKAQTEDKSITKSASVHKFDISGNGGKYYSEEKTLSTNKMIDVEINYTNHRVANMTDTNVFEPELQTTSITATVTDGDIFTVVQDACKAVGMTNVYDNLTFYSASQFEYVKSIAADIDKRISTTEPCAAYINPANLAKPSTTFSGVYDNSEKFIDNLNSAEDKKWVKYYNGDTEINYNEIAPDLSNISKIEVYAYDMQKTYTTVFYYPNSNSSSPNVNFAGNKLYTYTVNNSTSKDNSTRYNQLLSSDTTAAIKSMKIPDNKVFDGWYKIEWNSDNITVKSYLKVSSEIDYKYRITESGNLYAVFRDNTENAPKVKATAIANSVDVFSETVDGTPTTMYRYNTLLNICDCSDNDININQVGVVYVKLGANQDYGNLQDLKDQLLIEVKNANFTTTTSKSDKITINSVETPYSYYNYKVGNGNDNTVKLTAKNRMQFILKLKESQATEGSYKNVLAFTVFKYGNDWNISENCIQYNSNLNDKYETTMITN